MFTPEPSLPGTSVAESAPTEFEFVLGRRQVASVSLVALIALGIVTTAAYMAGKSTVPAVAESVTPKQIETIPQAPKAEPIVNAETPTPPAAAPAEVPLFGIPEKDHVYIQLGSVERGFALLMVHGARKIGYTAFAAGGSNPNVFRVLVGPFDDKAQYQIAKALFSSMGLDTFSRKYVSPSDPSSAEPSAEGSIETLKP